MNQVFLVAQGGNFYFLNEMKNKMKNKEKVILIKTKVAKKRTLDNDFIIRYGAPVGKKCKGSLNSVSAINLASNKYEARLKMQEAKVNTPNTIAFAVNVSYNDFPVIVRKRHHMQGKGFHMAYNRKELIDITDKMDPDGYYISEFIDKDKEFRVHVGHGKVIAIQEKVSNSAIIDRRRHQIWNRVNGFTFEHLPWNMIPKGLCPIAVEATNSCGLDFGAVDIVRHYGEYYVLEINTAPRLEGYTGERYAKYFDWIIDNEFKVEHFNDPGKYMMRFKEDAV